VARLAASTQGPVVPFSCAAAQKGAPVHVAAVGVVCTCLPRWRHRVAGRQPPTDRSTGPWKHKTTESGVARGLLSVGKTNNENNPMRSRIITALFGLSTIILMPSCDEAPGDAQDDDEAGVTDEDRGPIGKADLFGSCEGTTCDGPSPAGNCWCDDLCTSYGDCCGDREAICELPEATWRDVLPQGAVNVEVWMQGTTRHSLNGYDSDSNPPSTFQRCTISGENPGDVEVKCSPDGTYGTLAATVHDDGSFGRSARLSYRWEWSYDGEITADGQLIIQDLELIEGWRNSYNELVRRINTNVGPLTAEL